MKKTLVSSILLLCILSGLAAAEGLVAHWTLDEGSGTTVTDSAGSCNGTMSGATWTMGQINGGLSFDGSSDYVNFGDVSALEGFSKVTIASWIYWQGTSSYEYCIFGKESVYKIDVSGSHIRFLTGNNWSGTILRSKQTLQPGQWYHVAAVYDGSKKYIYINGARDPNYISTTGGLGASNLPAGIGAFSNGYYWKNVFVGVIDDVRVYNSALDANEIAELYNEAAAPTEINDHFDDGVLDPAWKTTYNNASGWTCSESGTNFTVTDITAPVSNAWNDVSLTREFSAPGDFEIKAKISWDSDRLYSAMQTLYIRAYSGNTIVAESGYCDAWITRTGGKVAKIEPSYSNNCQMNTLPVSGNVEITIKRENGFAAIFWDSTAILTGYSSSPVDKVEIIFSKYVYPGSTFGSLSVDYFTAVAESQKVLQRIGIVGPNSVPEESESQYKVKAYYGDGTNEDITADSNLTVNNDEFAYFDANGVMKTERLYRPREKCIISAEYDGLTASLPVTIYAVCNGVQCTNKQMINRNISDTIAIKQDVLEQLKYARQIEKATFQMMAASAREYKAKNILKARIELLAAITYETWACAKIDDSIDNLEDVNSIISK
jgi:hypothetical protein